MARLVCIITDRYGPNRLLVDGVLGRSHSSRSLAISAAWELAGEALESGDHMDLYEEQADHSLAPVIPDSAD